EREVARLHAFPGAEHALEEHPGRRGEARELRRRAQRLEALQLRITLLGHRSAQSGDEHGNLGLSGEPALAPGPALDEIDEERIYALGVLVHFSRERPGLVVVREER